MILSIKGMADAQAQLKLIVKGCAEMQANRVLVGTRLPYGWGIHFGRHRVSGGLARKKGGAMYLTKAVDKVLSQANRDLAEGLKKVNAPGVWVMMRLGRWIRAAAKPFIPVGTGRDPHPGQLRKSIRVIKRGYP